MFTFLITTLKSIKHGKYINCVTLITKINHMNKQTSKQSLLAFFILRIDIINAFLLNISDPNALSNMVTNVTL